LIVLHIGAALKHQFIDKDGVLSHMVPGLKPGHAAVGRAPSSPWVERAVGIALVLAVAVAGAIAARPYALPESQVAAAATTPAEAPVPAADAPVTPGSATAWTIDPMASNIEFTGTHAGKRFEGRFERWQGQVWFDPADLAGSKAVVTVQTASARTGDPTQEGSLQGPEWLNPEQYPVARFEAGTFRSLGGDRYEATGTLRIKATTIPVVLPFRFSEADGVARVEGALELDRTALDLGMASDATADWVSKMIGVRIEVSARHAP
jgi:cytochrome b561